MAETYGQRDYRHEPIFFAKSGKIFCFGKFFIIFTVRGSGFRDLLGIAHGVVEHIPHRHGVMSFGLRFNAQYEINGPLVLHSGIQFQYIAKPLNRFFCIYAVGQCDYRSVQFLEFVGSDYLPSLVEPKIEYITKMLWIREICLCFRVNCPHAHHILLFYLNSPLRYAQEALAYGYIYSS